MTTAVSQDRFTGAVKVFYALKGYGFITRPKGRDVFFHYQDVMAPNGEFSLLEGDQVEFNIGTRPDGKVRALNIKKVA